MTVNGRPAADVVPHQRGTGRRRFVPALTIIGLCNATGFRSFASPVTGWGRPSESIRAGVQVTSMTGPSCYGADTFDREEDFVAVGVCDDIESSLGPAADPHPATSASPAITAVTRAA